ncbi:glycosyltransferase family 4 protein [Labilibaculum antarcticum]|uniref:Glycosyl transferase group 1 n=1 Tax=Labilibaculum antarcticum TaxID=1717717 RepID=A0A1Y1CJK5_9BACT|nr:glycosyltransferase family 4 protein [Labilibaculum antarcticum]BAX80263.1 glycosyl transferase group 1 [Labilibaculum antarcticum]
MNIALCHFRVGETDGVSLEMDKWKAALEQLGHKVIYIAGSAGNCEAEIIPDLHYQHPINNRIVENVYKNLVSYCSEKDLKKEIFSLADSIERDLINLIEKNNIDLIVPNNILSLGWGLSAGIAFTKAIQKTGVRALCHHHDFHWERDLYSNPKVDFAADLLKEYFPPVHERISHVCINHIAKGELKARYGVEADVVPNVFDFQEEVIVADEYNKDLRKVLGVNPGDLVFMQATRLVERKAIELAIDFVSEIGNQKENLVNKILYSGHKFESNSEIYLVFAGKNESPDYYERLMEYAEQKGVNVLDSSENISHKRSFKSGNKIYSLWDAYSIADMITYPSILEGWGNQFLEAIVAKLPVVVYKYPVYLTDIESFNFNVISLGSKHVLQDGWVKVHEEIVKSAADEAIPYLLDSDYRNAKVNFNYKIASEKLSVNSLQEMLSKVLGDERN